MDMKVKSADQRVKPRGSAIQLARKLHLYGGVLFAPALMFFALTGAVQVLDLHKARAGYQPPPLLQRLGALHKNQTFALPHKGDDAELSDGQTLPKKHKAKASGKQGGGPSAASPPPPPRPPGLAQMALKGFALAVAFGLAAVTALGVYMAYRFNRNPWLTGALLIAGIAAPIALIALSPG